MTFAKNNKASCGRGFTIIEMLAVLFILAIIVALIASVSVYVLNEANKKDTRSSMAVIQDAILLYIDITGVKPTQDGGCTMLFTQLKSNEQTFAKIKELPDSVFQGQNPRSYFCDAWGKQLRYRQSEGRGGSPVLISAGPDSWFGDEPGAPSNSAEDNIRSDQP